MQIEPGCDGWKANALTTTLCQLQQCKHKMPYLNQMLRKRQWRVTLDCGCQRDFCMTSFYWFGLTAIFFFYQCFADLLHHILCPSLVIHTSLCYIYRQISARVRLAYTYRLIKLDQREKHLAPMASITYKKPKTLGSIFTNYKLIAHRDVQHDKHLSNTGLCTLWEMYSMRTQRE